MSKLGPLILPQAADALLPGRQEQVSVTDAGRSPRAGLALHGRLASLHASHA